MKRYPPHYAASASARAIGNAIICAADLPSIETAPPPEFDPKFDGPGGIWSSQMLLCAAVADCFILTFRVLARASHFNWMTLDCRVEGLLEHLGAATQFTRFLTAARLTIPPGADETKARRLLDRAEHGCLIANSLRGERTLLSEVLRAGAASDAPDAPKERTGESTGRGALARRAEARRLS